LTGSAHRARLVEHGVAFTGTIAPRVRFLLQGTAIILKEKTMNKISSGLLATALSVSFAAAEIVPVNAQPNYVPQGQDL